MGQAEMVDGGRPSPTLIRTKLKKSSPGQYRPGDDEERHPALGRDRWQDQTRSNSGLAACGLKVTSFAWSVPTFSSVSTVPSPKVMVAVPPE